MERQQSETAAKLKTVYWIWFAQACGPESSVPISLFSHTNDIEMIYSMNRSAYRSLGIHDDTEITALCNKDLSKAKRIFEYCEKRSIGILTLESPLYPHRLRNIQDPPAVLYYRGFLPDFDKRLAIAMVGTRGMTDEGRTTAYRLSFELAVTGTVIVSGMALGIDGIAQKAALDAGGCSVAVLGSAIDHCYPQEHVPLYKRLIEHGGILSEYAPGTETRPWHFPQRNRIISGLCQGTVVAEAGRKSGALITAQYAYLQGRDLFAVPGDPLNPARMGTNDLIKAGAIPVTYTTDILYKYESMHGVCVFPRNIGINSFYYDYDDTLRYGNERVERRREELVQETDPPPLLSTYRMKPPHIPDERPIYFHCDESGEIAAREEPISAWETEGSEIAAHTAVSNTHSKAEQLIDAAVRSAHTAEKPIQNDAPDISSIQGQASSPRTQQTEPSALIVEKENRIQEKELQKQKKQDSLSERQSSLSERQNSLTERQKKILSMIQKNMSFDEMCASGMSAAELMSDLTLLEISGHIESRPGGYLLK
ncbi:MAG: DNA-processing protein DprA [Clostridia bacterium]|nr:DNA-processing protein DprA [Clostridia bacterium]